VPANAFDIVKSFEREVANYTGAPYCVAVNSCTNALFLALKYHNLVESKSNKKIIEVPKKTYVSVPMQIIHAGFKVGFRDQEWRGAYRLRPLNVWDSARRFTSNMFEIENINGQNHYMCVSFHWSKILGVQQGGAIIHNDPKFDEWARRARFDGRTEGVAPKDDTFQELGYHMYMSPEIAAEGLVRLMHLPKVNEDLKNDDYPDLSKYHVFR
jgi:dTDP-4-amino-4,6-dideoxygalactose transaminase